LTRSSAAPNGASAEPHAGRVRHRRWFAWWRALRPSGIAWAQDPGPPTEAAARALLEEYRRAHEAGDVDRLAALYVSFPEDQRRAVVAYLQDTTHLRVELADVKIQPRDHDAVVSYTRRDHFVDKETGEP